MKKELPHHVGNLMHAHKDILAQLGPFLTSVANLMMTLTNKMRWRKRILEMQAQQISISKKHDKRCHEKEFGNSKQLRNANKSKKLVSQKVNNLKPKFRYSRRRRKCVIHSQK